MTDNNNNVTMTAETPVVPAPVAPDPAIPAPVAPIPEAPAPVAPIPEAPAPVAPEAEALAEQEEAAGTLTITVTDKGESYHSGVDINGTFNGMMFVVGLAAAVNAISNSAKVPSFVILSKLFEVYSHPDAAKEEQTDEDTEV